MKKKDLKSIQHLAKKNREASKAQHEAEAAMDRGPKTKSGRDHRGEEPSRQDPRYEGADRLFTEMKKKDRP